MSVTSIVVIFLVVCMALGPVLMLQPSKRQKRLARLRLEAAVLGLTVRMQRVSGDELAVYSIPWPSDTKRKYKGEDVYLKKMDYEHGLHLMGRWEAQPQVAKGEQVTDLLEELIKMLPDSVVGIESTPGGLGLVWRETGGTEALEVMAKSLNSVRPKLWLAQSEQKIEYPTS